MSGRHATCFMGWSTVSSDRLRKPGIHRSSIVSLLLLALLVGNGAWSLVSAQETVIPNGAQWRWRKGTNEVSNPNTLWRGIGFNDAAWSLGNAPFHFGTNVSGGDEN